MRLGQVWNDSSVKYGRKTWFTVTGADIEYVWLWKLCLDCLQIPSLIILKTIMSLLYSEEEFFMEWAEADRDTNSREAASIVSQTDDSQNESDCNQNWVILKLLVQ